MGNGLPLTVQFMSKASKRAHRKSDMAVNSRLVGLFADTHIYAGAIGCFFLIFEHLENHLETHASADPRLADFLAASRPLFRAAAFREDLRFFLGPKCEEELRRRSRFPAVESYLSHLSNLAADHPVLLIAHSFTQHLAVASGGQIISKIVRSGLALGDSPSDGGTTAFLYPSSQPRELKAALKDALDALESSLTSDEVAALIAEHQAAFAYNNAIIRGYSVGWMSPVIAAVKLAARSRKVVLIAVAAAAAAALAVSVWQRGG